MFRQQYPGVGNPVFTPDSIHMIQLAEDKMINFSKLTSFCEEFAISHVEHFGPAQGKF